MQLCEQDIVERLLNMSSALRQAYVYYQTLLQAKLSISEIQGS